MTIFGLKVIKGEGVLAFYNLVKVKLSDNNLVNNPFIGGVKCFYPSKREVIFLFDIRPVYPNFSFMGWPVLAVMYYFLGFSWLLVLPVFLICFGVFWTGDFYY